jgi:heme/copper-type cytochrome/quinol oxidase subunit 3
MSDILGKTFSFVTAAIGVNQMDANNFRPTTIIIFIIGILGLSFVSGLLGEFIGEKFKKGKKNVMGLGNRHG